MIPDYVMSQVNVFTSGGCHVVGAELDGRLVVLFDVDWGLDFDANLIKDYLNPNHFIEGK